MKLSTKVRYGVRAMIDLANHQNSEPILVKAISDRQQISKKYLESLLAALKAAGLVRSVRGAKGGYKLAHDPGSITLEQITNALDGPPILVECCEEPDLCERSGICAARDLWLEMTQALQTKLRETSLADMARRAVRKERKGGKAKRKIKTK
jgi:Rrf2 family protein